MGFVDWFLDYIHPRTALNSAIRGAPSKVSKQVICSGVKDWAALASSPTELRASACAAVIPDASVAGSPLLDPPPSPFSFSLLYGVVGATLLAGNKIGLRLYGSTINKYASAISCNKNNTHIKTNSAVKNFFILQLYQNIEKPRPAPRGAGVFFF